MMEKRNNSLQTATENTQARVLHAEQEKVKQLGREKPRSGWVELRNGPVYILTSRLSNRIFAVTAKRTRYLPAGFMYPSSTFLFYNMLRSKVTQK